jgi:hypothetical protein
MVIPKRCRSLLRISHGIQFGLHRRGAESMSKGAVGKAIFVGPRHMRKDGIQPDDGFLLLENDTW